MSVLVHLARRRLPIVVVVVSGVLAVAGCGSSSRPSFRPSIYPPPVHSRGGALAACPNPAGLESFTTAARSAARNSASRLDRVSEAVDLGNADRAWWPQIRVMWRTGKPAKGAINQVVDGSESASRSGYAVIVRFSCGQALVAKSLMVVIGPGQTHPPYCEACKSHAFFVNRRGRALIYFVY